MAKHGSPGAASAVRSNENASATPAVCPTYDHYSAEVLRHSNEVLDRLLAERRGLKPFEGRCTGCGKVISSKAPNGGRRTCSAVYPKWSRDQRRVTAEALREYGGLLLLTDVTLPGTPEQERHRRNVAIPWGADRRGEAKGLYKANRRFKRRMRRLKRKAYNDARSVLRKAGYEFERLPPVLVGNLEVQKRGALQAHLALPYTTPLEMTFSRAFIDAMKRWARLCGLGYVQIAQSLADRRLGQGSGMSPEQDGELPPPPSASTWR
jgi:hypothetical protein